MKKVATRFAPSPTGPLHIGGVRTALFNWLYSKNQKGNFYLRVEDTDKERSKDEYKNQIIQSLKWIGINYDGDEYIQSKKLMIILKLQMHYLKMGTHINVTAQLKKLKNKKKELHKKKFPIYMTENVEIKQKLMLQKISSLL